jgi:hypothetical protein
MFVLDEYMYLSNAQLGFDLLLENLSQEFFIGLFFKRRFKLNLAVHS